MRFIIIIIIMLSFTTNLIGSELTWNSNNKLLQQVNQQLNVSGKVTDPEGNPLPGTTVVVKGTTLGSSTDTDGNFSLNNVPRNATLIFSFVGMRNQEVFVGDKSIFDIIMEYEAVGIEEVVVVGYGTKKKADITGSISVVNTNDLAKMPARSAQAALQGMAAGVNVINQGAPGASSKILIRGVTNFGDTDPLIIVDGVEQDLNNVSAADIESIQVLKDAGAASIYGVRGANGVILVTTKKGTKGSPTVEYSGYYGMKYPIPGNPYNLLNSNEFMQVYNTAFPGNGIFADGMPDYVYRGPSGAGVGFEGDPHVNPSLYLSESPNQGNNYIIQKVNKEGTDWFHELFKRAPTTDHNISVRGGSDKSNFLLSVGYLDEQGTMVESYLKRYSARVNSDFKIGRNIRVGENIYMFYRNTGPTGSASAWNLFPIIPLKDIGGNWGGTFGGPEFGDAGNNVASQYLYAKNRVANQWSGIGNLFAEVDFLKYFTVQTSLGFNVYNTFNQDFDHNRPENTAGHAGLNTLSVSSSYGSTLTFTNTLKYNRDIGKHNISGLFGSEAIKFNGRGLSGSRRDYFSTDYNFLILQNANQEITNSSSIASHSLLSLFGRLDYAYDHKYLFSGTLRRDGSSKFGPENRYGVFPSVSSAWRMSQENFMKEINWLDDLKIRGSWGILGSQNNVPADNAFNLYSSGGVTSSYYDISGTGSSMVQGWARSRLGNSVTGWEKNIVTNVGIDMILFKNALDISLEWYKKKIEGLLFSEPLPAVLGYEATAPMINIGDIQNTGVDVSATYRGKIGNGFRFSVGANITSYNNKIVNIPDPGYFDGGDHQAFGSMVRNEVGHPVSSFFGYKYIGLFNSDEEVETAAIQTGAAPGRLRFKDIDGDGEITPNDRIHIGDPNPDFTYGINLGFEFKNFDFSAFFYGSKGNDIFYAARADHEFVGFYPSRNKSRKLLNAWTPENTNTTVPKVESVNSFSTFGAVSSYFVEDGSYLKLKSLVLGYTINPSFLDKVGISKLRLYVQAANVFTITNYSGLDPELIGGSSAVGGIDTGTYPKTELNLIGGVNVTF